VILSPDNAREPGDGDVVLIPLLIPLSAFRSDGLSYSWERFISVNGHEFAAFSLPSGGTQGNWPGFLFPAGR
jgi:hypothetical protein